MKRLNRILAALALAVLVVTFSLMYWLRRHVSADIDRSIQTAAQYFNRDELLYGPGGTALVRFGQAERQLAYVCKNPSIHDAVLTKLTEAGEEIPIVPFRMLAEKGRQWPQSVKGWQKQALGSPPFGYLYLDVDYAALRSMNWAIGALGLAIAMMLFTLLARLWSQETSLTRTVIELDARRRELIRIERLALAGQLAASLLHDLRKPVLHIKHSLDDLADALGDFAPAATALQDLRRQTRLFFQMLAESQIERFVQSDRAGEEYVDIVPMLDLSLNLVRYERRGVEVIRRETDGLPTILAQPFRLIQLFSNLILNAYQALNGRGQLTIKAASVGDGVEILFIDNGPGITQAMLENIFDPFFTTKPEGEGSGLGLSICRMIVDDLGGQISAHSQAGGPTTFRIWLPARTSLSVAQPRQRDLNRMKN